MIIKPPRLKPHGTIGVITPASPVKPDRLQRGIAYFERKGYRIELGKHVQKGKGYLAGTDAERLEDLHTMFSNPAIDAIICARGGYGTPRILDKIDYAIIRNNPKIFIGYSDLTALQLAIFQKTGLITFSGPMLGVEFAEEEISVSMEANFWRLISEPIAFGAMAPMHRGDYPVIAKGDVTGRLLGGCMALINCIIGTEFLPDLKDAVLLFEDVGESPMRVDRYLSQLRYAGILKAAAGIVIGRFEDSETEDEMRYKRLTNLLHDYFDTFSGPVINKFEYGHFPAKYTIPIGANVRLRTDPATVDILESVVT